MRAVYVHENCMKVTKGYFSQCKRCARKLSSYFCVTAIKSTASYSMMECLYTLTVWLALLTVMWELHLFMVCVTLRVNRLITHWFFMVAPNKHSDTSHITLDKQNMFSHWIVLFYSIFYSLSIDPCSYKLTCLDIHSGVQNF